MLEQILEARLGEARLLEFEESQRLLVERGRHLFPPRVVHDHLPEFLHRLFQRALDLVGLPLVGVAPGQAEVGLADPVLGVVGQVRIGEPSQELPESRDRERVIPLAEVDVRRLINVGRLGAPRRPRRGRGGSGRRRPRGRRRRRPHLAAQHLHPLGQLVHARREAGEIAAQRLGAGLETGQLLLDLRRLVARPPLELAEDGFSVSARAMDSQRQRGHVLAELRQILLDAAPRHRGASRQN